IKKERFGRRRASIRSRFLLFTVLVAAVVGVGVLSRQIWNVFAGRPKVDFGEIAVHWEAEEFDEVYRLSSQALELRPMDGFLLMMRGFSAYQLGIAQVSGRQAQDFFDQSIGSLGKALLLREAETDGRLHYVLGKAYFYKGDGFADLVIEYLQTARKLGFRAADIPQFLGLAYAAMGDYAGSVVAFSEALEMDDSSALLLLEIARSYVALGEFAMARAYLMQGIDRSFDSRTTLQARLVLAEVLKEQGDRQASADQLVRIIEENGENAEARFRLGEIFAEEGDMVRARAEWRRAYAADPTHVRTRERLSL
ncbi:MAG: tetratricopeptide repeat protein, partial [Treponema sp.]|nr:tetratricopeptide repeat protein [Treponema sp.]